MAKAYRLRVGRAATSSFVLGTTKPDATNTGVPAGTTLTLHSGDWTISTPNTVIDGYDITGMVTISAANVTIRNCLIRGRNVGFVYYGLVNCRPHYTGTLIERCTIRADYPRYWLNGIDGGNFTSHRNDISGCIDPHNTNLGNITVTGNYCHDFYFANDDGDQATSDPRYWSHNDGVQFRGGGVGGFSTVRGNNFYWYPDTASPIDHTAILATGARNDIASNLADYSSSSYYRKTFLSDNPTTPSGRYLWGSGITISPDAGPVTDLSITENWFEGGGACVQIGNGSSNLGVNNNIGTIANNRFGGDQFNFGAGSRYQIRYKNGQTIAGLTTNYWDSVPTVAPGLWGVPFADSSTGGIRHD